jgi:hypothetical protein
VRKISPPWGFDPRTVQSVGSRYTDYATRPTSRIVITLNKNFLSFSKRKIVISFCYNFIWSVLTLLISEVGKFVSYIRTVGFDSSRLSIYP